jgi:excisionase family DNA binding protein
MKEFLSIKEVAEYLGVDYKTIYRLVQQAEIPAGKVGGVYRIRRNEVEAYFERQQQALAQEAARAQVVAQAPPLKCGRCLRLVTSHEVAGTCGAPDCDQPLCPTCWQDDPDHRCRNHIVSREALLRRAEAQLAQAEIPLLLKSDEARRRQVLYLGRVEAKLRERPEIPHPLSGRTVRISDWTAIETRTAELDRLREVVASDLSEAEIGRLPTNPQYAYRLASDLVLRVVVHSDLIAHLKLGFVAQPSNQRELFDLLERAIGRAEREDSFTVLGLAATAGWDAEALAHVQGQDSGPRPFYHRLVAPVLVDLATEQVIRNATDARLDQLAPVFSPEMTVDVVQEVMAKVEALLVSPVRTGVTVSEVVEQEGAPAAAVAAAFDRLAASGRYLVEEMEKRDRLLLRRTA